MIRSLLRAHWKEGGLVVAILFLLVQWRGAETDLKKARLSYEHPQTKEVIREVKVRGPERIVYRTIRLPGEKEIIEKIIEREATTTTKDSGKESRPISVGTILASHRSDRWLLSVGANRLSADFDSKAVFVGYGFRNRLDLQVGAVHKETTSPWLLATLRF